MAERTKTFVATSDARARREAEEVGTARTGRDGDWCVVIRVLSCVAEAGRIPRLWTNRGRWLQPRHTDAFGVN